MCLQKCVNRHAHIKVGLPDSTVWAPWQMWGPSQFWKGGVLGIGQTKHCYPEDNYFALGLLLYWSCFLGLNMCSAECLKEIWFRDTAGGYHQWRLVWKRTLFFPSLKRVAWRLSLDFVSHFQGAIQKRNAHKQRPDTPANMQPVLLG